MKKKHQNKLQKGSGLTRREYLKTSLLGTAGLFMAPSIVPSTVFGKTAPSNKIHIAQIGCGRIARGHDLPETLKEDDVRVVAVSDVDRNRMEDGKRFIEGWYEKEKNQKNFVNVQMYQDFREMIENAEIDAVVISTPDHAHVLPTLYAAVNGKDVYLQKPHSLTLEEGRIMSNVLQRMGTVFQVGSQQRAMTPWPQFKRACELVRNGRIGQLHTIKIGLPGDPAGGDPTPMPVPENLDYDMWLGTTPVVPYTVDRVHPLEGYSRPGWLRCEQFSAGMITGWGAHHIDTAHWGMGTEYTGPVEIEAEAEFPTDGLWTVHGKFKVEAKYANGVTMYITGDYPNGVRFEGEDGWIFVTRGPAQVTASDPDTGNPEEAPLQASNPSILNSEMGPNELHLKGVEGEEHHTNWIRHIRNRRLDTSAPAEVSHRSTSACLISHIAMKLPRKLYWDPINERFKDDDEANAMLSRPQRYPYRISEVPGLKMG
ncbi:MAG: Gfo/Idh/MocA family oxidoreductase [Balneolaceae bacterium]